MTTELIPTAEGMTAHGLDFSQHIKAPHVFYLIGDLGAGKTTWVRGVLQGLGVTDTVQSPTYPIIKHYQVDQLRIAHIDLYRLQSQTEYYEAGLDDATNDADILFVEWPSRCPDCLPPADTTITITITGDGHLIDLMVHNED